MIPPTQSIELSCDEIIVITDRVKNDDVGTEDMRICTYELLRKLGGSYIEAAEVKLRGSARNIPIDFTEPEVWLLRSRVNSQEKSSTDPLWGVKLLVKLYTALIAFGSPVADLPGGETTEPTRAELQKVLQDWRAQEDAQHGAESNQNNADYGAQDGSDPPVGAGENLPATEDKDRGANPEGVESIDATS